MDSDFTTVIGSKNEARLRKIQRGTRAADEQYKETRREANEMIRIKKHNYKQAESQFEKTYH